MTRMSHVERRARAEEAAARFKAGERAVALADEYGVSLGHLYVWVRTEEQPKPKVRPTARTGRILRMLALEQNLTAAQIAEKLGVPERNAAQDLTNMKSRGYLASKPVTYSLAEQGLSALGGL